MIYNFAKGFRLKTEAQVVGEYLADLEQQYGELNSKILVEEAEDAGSPVHGEFEWNDAKAAVAYRDSQAQYILRAVVATITDEKGEEHVTRAFVNLGPGEGHTSITKVLISEDDQRKLLEKCVSSLRSWYDKYSAYKDLLPICNGVLEVLRPAEQQLFANEEKEIAATV